MRIRREDSCNEVTGKIQMIYPESYKVFSECWLYLIQKGDIQKTDWWLKSLINCNFTLLHEMWELGFWHTVWAVLLNFSNRGRQARVRTIHLHEASSGSNQRPTSRAPRERDATTLDDRYFIGLHGQATTEGGSILVPQRWVKVHLWGSQFFGDLHNFWQHLCLRAHRHQRHGVIQRQTLAAPWWVVPHVSADMHLKKRYSQLQSHQMLDIWNGLFSTLSDKGDLPLDFPLWWRPCHRCCRQKASPLYECAHGSARRWQMRSSCNRYGIRAVWLIVAVPLRCRAWLFPEAYGSWTNHDGPKDSLEESSSPDWPDLMASSWKACD